MTTPKSKKCSKCLKTKRLTSFYALADGKYGVRAKCKVCMNSETKSYYKPRPKVITPTGARLTALFEQGLKECGVCKTVKKLDSYWKRPSGHGHKAYDNLCVDCRKQSKKDWHAKRNLDVRNFLFTYRVENGCVDCGQSDPRVLEFDHLRDKKFNLGQAHMVKGITLKEVKAEVRKCVVRCSNCHKRKTHKEQDTWLHTMYEEMQAKEGSNLL